MKFIFQIMLTAIIFLTLTACNIAADGTIGGQNVTLSQNFTGPQGATGPTGPAGTNGTNGTNGNFTGTFTGNTTFTGASNNFTGNLTWGSNTTFQLVGNRLIIHGYDTTNNAIGDIGIELSWGQIAFTLNGSQGRFAAAGMQLSNGLFEMQKTGVQDFRGYQSANASGVLRFTGSNTTSSSQAVASIVNGVNRSAFWQFDYTPKFNVTSISGPASNVTILGWLPIICDLGGNNVTAYMPLYK